MLNLNSALVGAVCIFIFQWLENKYQIKTKLYKNKDQYVVRMKIIFLAVFSDVLIELIIPYKSLKEILFGLAFSIIIYYAALGKRNRRN